MVDMFRAFEKIIALVDGPTVASILEDLLFLVMLSL